MNSYSLRFAIALMTFTFGVGLFNVFKEKSVAQQSVVTESVPQTEFVPPRIAEIPVASQPDSTEDAEYEFNAEGDYYIFSYGTQIENLPKPFESFNEISIKTTDYKKASEENNYQGVSIPPEGYVFANKEYKFIRISIGNRQISFETETKKGISYKFVGEFTDYVKFPKTDFDLQGDLIKMRNGKKIGQTKINLVAGGC